MTLGHLMHCFLTSSSLMQLTAAEVPRILAYAFDLLSPYADRVNKNEF
jgi:hypothetical protein